MMKQILVTDRLILREFTTSDASFIFELLNSEDWLRYIGDRNIKTISDAENYLTEGPIKSYKLRGFGLYAVCLKETGLPIGMCGLLKREFLDYPDVGFAFLPRFFGNGYGSEMVMATLKWGFNTLAIDKIQAIVAPGNQVSIALLHKLGFAYEKKVQMPEGDEILILYTLTSDDLLIS